MADDGASVNLERLDYIITKIDLEAREPQQDPFVVRRGDLEGDLPLGVHVFLFALQLNEERAGLPRPTYSVSRNDSRRYAVGDGECGGRPRKNVTGRLPSRRRAEPGHKSGPSTEIVYESGVQTSRDLSLVEIRLVATYRGHADHGAIYFAQTSA